MIDHRGAIKDDIRAQLLANLERLDPSAPWTAFPLPALSTEAPVEAFHAFYGAR